MMEKKGKLFTQTDGDVTVVFFMEARILDDATIQEVARELFAMADNSYRPKIILNFENVDYLSSAVLGKIVAFHKKIKEAKGIAALCQIKPTIREVFKITKLDKVLAIYDTQAAAMKNLRGKKFKLF